MYSYNRYNIGRFNPSTRYDTNYGLRPFTTTSRINSYLTSNRGFRTGSNSRFTTINGSGYNTGNGFRYTTGNGSAYATGNHSAYTNSGYRKPLGRPTYKPEYNNRSSSPLHRTPSPDRSAGGKPRSLKIRKVDLQIEENATDHHTDKYDITNRQSEANLVIRRGQKFKVQVTLNRDYQKDDKIRVEATFGETPMLSKGTHVQMVTGEEDTDGTGWAVQVERVVGAEVVLAITTPASCAIGEWGLALDTVTVDEAGTVTSLMIQPIEDHCVVLFNAWCKDDSVYMADESWRQEYVLNDSGKVYTGSAKQIYGKPWNFGQFEEVSLQAALFLLDHSGLAATARGNPIVISRKLSALVNSNDDNGLIVGNWSGDYSAGKSPSAWTGSVAILKQYMNDIAPVKYGQCWVYSAVLTTICRAIGLPARSVTNFSSAHDTDGTFTIDMHYDENGEPLPARGPEDSVWNFHVWNEAWMTRPDLKAGYGGWQAFDATPQETSDGIYCAGPAPVAAIKNGDVGASYDAGFIFAEVNADRVHWFKMKSGRWFKQFEKAVIGKNISTKAIGPSRSFSYRDYNPDREDITSQYKHPEGSDLERAAVWNAASMSTKPNTYTDDHNQHDVVLKTKDIKDVQFGEDFELPIIIQNLSRSSRNVHSTVTLSSVYYTGIIKGKLKKKSFQCVVPARSEEECVVVVKAEEYMNKMADHNNTIQINYVGSVMETKQIWATQDDFRLRTMVPEATVSKARVQLGEGFHVMVSFKNPLNRTLTGCHFTFESAGNLNPTTVDFRNIPAGGSVSAKCDITAKRRGHCVIIASFGCNEMADTETQCEVNVEK